MTSVLDQLDKRLLELLQRDNLQTAERLAEQVGRSPSAVARRLRRLREDGTVAADVAMVSEAAAGHPLFAVIHVQLDSHVPHEGNALRRRLVANSHVQLCLDVTGSFDIVLVVVAADLETFNDFTATLLEQSVVRRFETSFVKKRHKATLAIPVS